MTIPREKKYLREKKKARLCLRESLRPNKPLVPGFKTKLLQGTQRFWESGNIPYDGDFHLTSKLFLVFCVSVNQTAMIRVPGVPAGPTTGSTMPAYPNTSVTILVSAFPAAWALRNLHMIAIFMAALMG